MKVKDFRVVMFVVFLMGCESAESRRTAMITAVPTCHDPGTILDGKIEESIRGYAYYFQVYLPPCYELETERSYPVLYLMPGWGGSSRNWFAAGLNDLADEMILDAEIPPFLIVATGNNDVDLLGEVVYQDLVPYIEANYRVLAERPYRAVAGGSLGGSRAYRLALNNPETFASAGVFGNGLVPGDEPQLIEWIEGINLEERPRFFFNTGFDDSYMLDLAQEMVGILDQAGYDTTTVFSEGDHRFAYWVSNMPTYWRWLQEDWQ